MSIGHPATAGSPATGGEAVPAPDPTIHNSVPGHVPVGPFSLRKIVDAAVAHAEGEAIRGALRAARGDKHRAAAMLSVSYHTLRAKMKRYGISSPVFPR